MPDRILKPNIKKGNYDTSEDENEALLPAAHTLDVNPEVHAAGVCNTLSSNIRDDSQQYDSQTNSNTFETAASSSAENVHGGDVSSMNTAYEAIEIDKNYENSTYTEEGKSTLPSFKFKYRDEKYRLKRNSVMEAYRPGIRGVYNFIRSKISGYSEIQGIYDSSAGNFMATKEVLTENSESDNILSIPSTSNVDEHAGAKKSDDNSLKSGDETSTGSYINSTTTIKSIEESTDSSISSTAFKSFGEEVLNGSILAKPLGSNANERIEISESESSSDNERIARRIFQLESPFREQQTQVSRNTSDVPNEGTILLSKLRDPWCKTTTIVAIALTFVTLLLSSVVTTVMSRLGVDQKTCNAVGIILFLFGIISCLAFRVYFEKSKPEERAAEYPEIARYDRLLDTIQIFGLPTEVGLLAPECI